MSEEKKYSIIGTVTIGADEYRDLIEEVAAAKKKLQKATPNNGKSIEREERLKKSAICSPRIGNHFQKRVLSIWNI